MIYTVDDGHWPASIEASSPRKAAVAYVSDGDWGDSDSTQWVTVRVTLGDDSLGDYKIPVEPPEPPCVDDEDHDWRSPRALVGGIKENPGVWGHGGGVVIHEVCMRCGCGRITDTWAQDPEDGEQGLTSVRYSPGEYHVEEPPC